MVTPIKNVKAPYGFSLSFEYAFVTMLCTRPKFFARVAASLEESGFTSPPAQLALRAAKAIAHDTSNGPETPLLVIQRIRRWQEDGRVTKADIVSVNELFDAAEDAGLPSEEALLAEAVPVLKRRLERESLEDAWSSYQKGGDTTIKLEAATTKIRRLGQQDDMSIGSLLGPATFDSLERLNRVMRLRTGIMELDDALEGGLLRATETVFMGGSGAGKSMALTQLTIASAMQGFHVGYGTLEVPKPIIEARLISNLSAVPINEILRDPLACGAREVLAKYQALPGFGRAVVQQFTPLATTVADLKEWVKQAEQEWGQRMDVIVIDYADKMRSRLRDPRQESNSYTSQGVTYEELYTWGRDENRWIITASQSRGRDEDQKKRLDLGNIADSVGKVRSSDYLITLNPRDEYTQMLFFLAKVRLGQSRKEVGPLPCDFSIARIAPVSYALAA